MHQNSILLFEKYAASYFSPAAKVLEIGPDEFPSTYQELCNRTGQQWDTLDVHERRGLTYAAKNPYAFPIPSGTYDVVVSANVLEHVPRIWAWVREAARVINPGGRLILVAPCSWPYHEAPYDCWRVYPEGMRALVEEAGLVPEILLWGSLEQPEFAEAIPGRSFEQQPESYRELTLKLAATENFPVEKSFDSICVARKRIGADETKSTE